MDDLKYRIALSHFLKFGPVRIKKLQKYFSNFKEAFEANFSEIIDAGIEKNVVEDFLAFRNKINPDFIVENLEKEKIKVIVLEDGDYPVLLSRIYNPPSLLYYRGDIKNIGEFSLAIVGSRKYTSYGAQIADRIARDLSRNNLTIVSGMALGIDTIAHLATIEEHKRTVAVLGTGIDSQSIYPSSNRYLVDKIIFEGGAVITEFSPGTPPLRHHFPQRNRIISGLSLGVLVVEAGQKSGALITAYHALEQNREVFAVPGSVFSLASFGPNKLIKEGARVVTGYEDIIETLDLAQVNSYIDNKKIIPDSEEERKILEFLSHDPKHINDLVCLTKINTAKINSVLVIMEMKGIIKNLGGMNYVLAR